MEKKKRKCIPKTTWMDEINEIAGKNRKELGRQRQVINEDNRTNLNGCRKM